jgi:small subunit ribosomal protein S16
MIKIRLRRTGSKKKASYRMVVAPSTAPRDGRFIEVVGHYNPRDEPPTVVVKEDRVFYWLSVGAQLSDSLKRILESQGTMERYAEFKSGPQADTPTAELETAVEIEAVDPEAEAESADTSVVETEAV